MTRQDVIELLERHLPPLYADAIKAYVRPTIRLKTQPSSTTSLPIGSSRIGGLPDLAPSTTWPISRIDKGQPLHFVAQIRLADVKPFDVEGLLPPDGLLSFFERYDEGLVLYTLESDIAYLQQRTPVAELPEKRSFLSRIFNLQPEQSVFETCEVIASLEFTFPIGREPHLLKLRETIHAELPPEQVFDETLLENFFALNHEELSTRRNQMLGFPQGVTDEYFELPGDNLDESLEWMLLIQLDSDENSLMNWGELGKIYFYIHQQDLKDSRFDRVKVITENY